MAEYELKNFSGNEIGGRADGSHSGGIRIKAGTALVLVFLALASAVGVGLIVHFAENRTLECSFPDLGPAVFNQGSNSGQQNGGQQGQPLTTSTTASTVPQPVPVTSSPTTVASSSATPSTTEAPPKRSIRLPGTFTPTHYDVKLKPYMYNDDPSTFTFDGSVAINMTCKMASRNVTLHMRGQNITNSSIRFMDASGASNSPKFTSYSVDKELEFLIIHLDSNTIPESVYTLSLEFVAPLKDDLSGLYYSSYKQGNQTVYLTTSDLEPSSARKIFPCFDEPAMKATFSATLVRKKHLVSISNMERAESKYVEDDFVEDIYKPTKRMSTYLLCFIVCNFNQSTTVVPGTNVTYRAWARPQLMSQTEFGLQVGANATARYNDYFNISYPLNKQGMIAIPDFSAGAMENWGLITYRENYMLYADGVSSSDDRQSKAMVIVHDVHIVGMIAIPDFSAGAMENWGLITYRENYMLYADGVSSSDDRQYTAMVIVHELAHQWFGNLVTLEWWEDVWLNEGFATFMEFYATGLLFPEWNMFDQFVATSMHKVLDRDAQVTSHPISSRIESLEDIHFDSIAYDKGGALLRMVRFIMGDDTFKRGIHRYLKAHEYANANHDDLWEAFTAQCVAEGKHLNITEIMRPWTLQMNYPVVELVRNGYQLTVTQKRFLKNASAEDTGRYNSSFGYEWTIPLTIVTSANPDFDVTDKNITLIRQSEKVVPFRSLAAPGGWFVANAQQYGYYRVNYEEANWQALIKQLKQNHTVIPPANRAQIINDAFSLARAGQLETLIALQTLEYLSQERNYAPWYAAARQISYVNRMLRNTDIYGQFQNYMEFLLKTSFIHFGMSGNDSTHMDSLTRELIAGLSCSYGMLECRDEARRLFDQWRTDSSTNMIDPNVRYTVYCETIRSGTARDWEFVYQQYQTHIATEQTRLMRSLACTHTPWLINRLLQLSLSPAIRKQDADSMVARVAGSSVGQLLTWDYVRSNLEHVEQYGKDVFSVSGLLASITSSFTTPLQLEQVETFLDQHPKYKTGSLNDAISSIRTNINWLKDNKKIVTEWLTTVTRVQ